MKITKITKREIKKEEFEQKLGIKIKNWVQPKDDNFLKIYTQTDYIVYLRCQDIKVLFDLDINVFDGDVKFEKDKIVLKDSEEIYRGKVKHLSKVRGL